MFLKLFKSNSESAELEALRRCTEQNEADRAWSESFYQRIAAAEKDVQVAQENLARAPSDATVEGLVSARTSLQAARLYDIISAVTTAAIGGKIFERTVPVLRAALAVTKNRLVEEVERLLELHRQQAAELGLSADVNAGGMVGALRGEIASAEGYISRIDNEKAAPSALRSMIEFCLSKSAS